MLLGTPLNKGPHTKQCMRSSPHHSFRQAHRRRLSDDDNVLHRFFSSGSSQLSQTSRPTRRAQRLRGSFQYHRCHWHLPNPICSFVPLWPKEWLPSLGLNSRFFFEKILVTQGFLYISPGVTLDKTSNTKGSSQLDVSPRASSIHRV